MKCAKCGDKTEGWKCAICGEESEEHDEEHLHEGSDRYCMPKCVSCGEADACCAC